MTDIRSSRARVSLGAALSIALGAFVLVTPVSGAALSTTDDTANTMADAARSGGLLGHEADAGLDVRDRVLPTSAQESAATALGAVDIRWNAHGTPTSLITSDGVLAAAGSSDPVTAARGFLADNAAVFGLTAAQLGDLELVSDQKLAGGGGHAVLFRQTYDGLSAATEGLVTVGVADGDITYVSSSLSKVTGTPAKAELTPTEAWLKAAASAGRPIAGSKVGEIVTDAAAKLTDWTKLTVPGLATDQLVRLRAFPVPGEGVRPVFQATVVDSAAATLLGRTVLVDAVTGEVLWRHDNVDHENDVEGPFTGTALGACGPKHSFEITDDKTRTIAAVAVGLPTDDFTVKLFAPDGRLLVEGDLLTSPETATYTAEKIDPGTYAVQVCPFDDSLLVGSYTVTVASSDAGADTGELPGSNPRWSYFPGTPDAASTGGEAVPTNDVIACWTKVAECTGPELKSLANAGPWDTLLNTTVGVPSLTTIGNNANTHEGWLSPIGPVGLAQAPVSPVRDYTGTFTDAWNNAQCAPTNLVPGGNDVNYVVGNLFASHNRMHDWSYFLGFTEENYNLQTDNLGRGGRGLDAEVGNAQAAALDSQVIEQTGILTGRNNANQLTLMDGVPGVTNQYLFQPAAGAFYAPCTDGSLDFGIVGHEYTHAISNRMVGGPDDGLTSEQGGAMGESWSDLAAAEHMFAHDLYNGGSPWAVGSYATGNTDVAIRDFAIDRNPLNFSDYGFDSTGPEVHADGEIWNGTMWSVRQALVDKYNATYPYADKALQRRCSVGTTTASPLAADKCPGNRRWIQLVFDSFLLQQGATSMLDARDAFLAADQMRFGGANRQVIADAFARRGMGQYATTTADDHEPTPSFASPASRNVKVTFSAPSGTPGKVYVGRFEARATPIADTLVDTAMGSVAHFVPGTYEFLYVTKTGGAQRKTVTISSAEITKTVSFASSTNLAAAAKGATVIASTEGSRNPDALIDGTEGTNWGGVTADNVDATTPSVAVDLAGGTHTVTRVNVSAYLSPATETDADSGSRFTALRKFALEACVSACTTSGAVWKRFYTSAGDAFPGKRPRPVAPNLNLRTFDVPDTTAAAVRLVALENQCTGFDGYAGEQDADPTTTTDCKTGSDRGTIVHAAELQVFGQ
ncbi:M36 family metallopeptidase [Nocardioides sp. NBC_00368]|uniref:M36 family metallopeptidase n=1 Tax=Nocardioides sp. NBC_00368 TaxID=2976000 RepID=UPI002E24E210